MLIWKIKTKLIKAIALRKLINALKSIYYTQISIKFTKELNASIKYSWPSHLNPQKSL